MECKKIASMEYGKIVFHSIPYHALVGSTTKKLHQRKQRSPVFINSISFFRTSASNAPGIIFKR